MIYLLDTNTCIQYFTGRIPLVTAKFKTVPRQDIAGASHISKNTFFLLRVPSFPVPSFPVPSFPVPRSPFPVP